MHSIDGTVVKNSESLKLILKENYHYQLYNGFAFIVEDHYSYNDEEVVFKEIEDLLKSIHIYQYLTISTNYFGGVGEQESTFHNIETKEEYHFESINKGLKMLGVDRSDNLDEFDIVGLGGIRKNKDVIPKKIQKERKLLKNEILTKKTEFDYQEWKTTFSNYSEVEKLRMINLLLINSADSMKLRSTTFKPTEFELFKTNLNRLLNE
jgi:hypothetical protein